MSLLPFRGRCHTCGHDHDQESQTVQEIIAAVKSSPSSTGGAIYEDLSWFDQLWLDDCGPELGYIHLNAEQRDRLRKILVESIR